MKTLMLESFSHLNFNFIYAESGVLVELQVPGMPNHIGAVKQKVIT